MKFRRTVRVRYPLQSGQLLLRTDNDWDGDLEPDSLDESGQLFTFSLNSDRPYIYFKPYLRQDGETHPAGGPNRLALMFEPDLKVDHPHFFSHGSRIERASGLPVYLPAGYRENSLAHYRVIYLIDDQEIFFPQNGTRDLLERMNTDEPFLVVSVGAQDTGRLVEEIKPLIDRSFRTRPGKADTAVLGTARGGVAAFTLAWEHPEVFVAAICMSSPFTLDDHLLERIYGETPRQVAFYLDSGWPGDNYEVTLAIATALVQRGWQLGRDLTHLSHPRETSWETRLQIPCQMFARSLREVQLQQHGSAISPA